MAPLGIKFWNIHHRHLTALGPEPPVANDGSPVIQLRCCARYDRSNEQLDLLILG